MEWKNGMMNTHIHRKTHLCIPLYPQNPHLNAGATSGLGRRMTRVWLGSVPVRMGHTVKARPKSVICGFGFGGGGSMDGVGGWVGGFGWTRHTWTHTYIPVYIHTYISIYTFTVKKIRTYRQHVPRVGRPAREGDAALALREGTGPVGVVDAESLCHVCVGWGGNGREEGVCCVNVLLFSRRDCYWQHMYIY